MALISGPTVISAAALLAIGAIGAQPGAQASAPADAPPAAPPQAPSSTLQCGTALVGTGETRDQVRAKCGAPVTIERGTAFVPSMAWVNGVPVAAGSTLIEVPVELWLYNFGPDQPLRRVRFESGRVVAIESLDSG